jgi:hypothetical protein
VYLKFLDIPKFKVRPNPNRFLIDKVLMLVGLGILLYIMIYVDYYLLDKDVPLAVNLLVIIGVVLLCVLELIVSYVRYGNYSYEFHEKRIVINGYQSRSIDYSDIHNVSYSTNFLDTWLKTGSIVLELKDGKHVKLKYLNNSNQAFFLLQKSVGR